MSIPKTPGSKQARGNEEKLRKLCLAYPETHEDMPWGHRAMKVRKKAFVFMGTNENGLFVTVKLPESNVDALDHDFCEPTGYGLGKSGWVSAQFGPNDSVPMELLAKWIDESFRAVAPKTVVKILDGGEPAKAPARNATKKATAKKKAAKKKATQVASRSSAKKTKRKTTASRKKATKKAR